MISPSPQGLGPIYCCYWFVSPQAGTWNMLSIYQLLLLICHPIMCGHGAYPPLLLICLPHVAMGPYVRKGFIPINKHHIYTDMQHSKCIGFSLQPLPSQQELINSLFNNFTKSFNTSHPIKKWKALSRNSGENVKELFEHKYISQEKQLTNICYS